MIVLPFSFLLLPVAVGLGVAYVRAGRLPDRRLRVAIRVGALTATCALPLFTRGPGPGQLILGLVVGYLGLRAVAVARSHGLAEAGIKGIVLQLITPFGILQPSTRQIRRPVLVILGGCAGIVSCVVLLVLGNQWRLWQVSQFGHFLDNQLVVLEIAVGAAGVHGLIVGIAQLFGRPVCGLLDHPFRSTSLGEFWGRRWNRMVQINLATGFYRPLARTGRPTLGLVAAFAASGAMHVVGVLGAGPLRVVALPCACVLWCFLCHGTVVIIEQRLGWHERPLGRWSHALARIRTLLLFLALTPGLIEPFAAVANVHGRSLASPDAQVGVAWAVAAAVAPPDTGGISSRVKAPAGRAGSSVYTTVTIPGRDGRAYPPRTPHRHRARATRRWPGTPARSC